MENVYKIFIFTFYLYLRISTFCIPLSILWVDNVCVMEKMRGAGVIWHICSLATNADVSVTLTKD